MSKDTILCAFNCSKTSPCTQWAERYFADPPKVVAIEGRSSTAFKQVGYAFTKHPQAWLNSKKIEGGRLAVATFSAGWGFVDALMRSPAARELVDSVLLLDGLHCPVNTLDPWVEYAKRAAVGGSSMPMLLMTHSCIKPPYTSARETNSVVFARGRVECPCPGDTFPQLEFLSPSFFTPITIKSAYGTRTWKEDPLDSWEGAGNLYRYQYAGNDAPTHIYIAKVVQPRTWMALAGRWNSGVEECDDLKGVGRCE